MNALKNKVAIVTGATSGIGYATARLFVREGAAVVVAARRKPELDALVKAIHEEGGQALAVAGDVGDENFAASLVEKTLERFGRLDIAFNNAAILGAMGPVWLSQHPRECLVAGRHGYGNGEGICKHARRGGICRQPARTKANCAAGGNCKISTLSGV